MAFLLPMIWHIALNRRYVSSLGHGRWSGPRALRLLLNLLLAASCLASIVSGCLISSELFSGIVPLSVRGNPLLYQLHSTAARYFLVLAGAHLGWHLPAWWQRVSGITSRPFSARLVLRGFFIVLGIVALYAAQQDCLLQRLQGAHIFMTPALAYHGAGYALTQFGILILSAEIGLLISFWKGVRSK